MDIFNDLINEENLKVSEQWKQDNKSTKSDA